MNSYDLVLLSICIEWRRFSTTRSRNSSENADFFGASVDYLIGRTDIIAPDKQQKSNLAEQFALKLIEQLENDGYTITEEDLPNLILAAKITLAQNKKIKMIKVHPDFFLLHKDTYSFFTIEILFNNSCSSL